MALATTPVAAPRLEEMVITVTADHPREYIISDKGAARTAMDRTSPYLPGDIRGRIPARVPVGRVAAYFGADVTAEAAEARARR